MPAQQKIEASVFLINVPPRPTAFIASAILAAIFTIAPITEAQTLSILHTFTGTGDGGTPLAGLTPDRGGNFYGTTSTGGAGYGTVFKLSHAGSGWVLTTLYEFQGGSDGANPFAGVVVGPDGALYGTTSDNYQTGEYGTVFRLTPPSHPCESIRCPWTETVLYRFAGSPDGATPGYGNLAFDAAGNIYGTTMSGGAGCQFDNCGVVFKLTRSGGSWTESVIYSFDGTSGDAPQAGVVLDSAGNLYGTAYLGGTNSVCGVVYELTPSGSSWREIVLHNFGDTGDGCEPFAGLIMDQQGNLYGNTVFGPSNNDAGSVYELQLSGGGWNYSFLLALPGGGLGPEGNLALDAAGNLYGTTYGDPGGSIFKVTPSGGSWIYTELHGFNGHDGSDPSGNVVVDAQGNVYGTTTSTSSSIYGEIWELTP